MSAGDTEAALRISESRYRTLAEAARDSIFIVDASGRVEYANAVSCERLRRPCEQVVGKEINELFSPAVAKDVWQHLSTPLSTRQPHYFECQMDLPSGKVWLGTWSVPIQENNVQPTSVMGVARDITDRKQLEQEYAQAQKMEAIGRLAGGVAHDFNNLLTAILGYSEIVREAVRHDPVLAADVDEIHKAGERATRLTRQLLAFSRKQEICPRIVDVIQTVRDLEKLLMRVIGEDVALEIATDPQLPNTKVDPGQLEQVIMNLAVNARDAMSHGGTLRIATSCVKDFAPGRDATAAGPFIALTVRDTGCGMTPDVLAHVFEPFFTTKPEGKGTGLGLSMVYGIATQAGGHAAIRSQPGVGTTVTVYLPVAGDDVQQLAEPAREAMTAAGTQTILVVDDDAGLLQLMQRILTRRGFQVIAASNAEEALKKARHFPGAIDVLVTDMIMPVTSGPDLAQRIVEGRPSMRVLFMSGYANAGAGICPERRFLAKPFTPPMLLQSVRECLQSPTGEFSLACGKFPTSTTA